MRMGNCLASLNTLSDAGRGSEVAVGTMTVAAMRRAAVLDTEHTGLEVEDWWVALGAGVGVLSPMDLVEGPHPPGILVLAGAWLDPASSLGVEAVVHRGMPEER